jgi:hypothetical protein
VAMALACVARRCCRDVDEWPVGVSRSKLTLPHCEPRLTKSDVRKLIGDL